MGNSVLRKMFGAAALGALLLRIPAQAQEPSSTDQIVAVGPSPIVRVQAQSGIVTVRTWDRPEVEIASSLPVDAHRFGAAAVERALPGGDVPILGMDVQSPQGPVRLQAEDFPVDGIAGAPHDGVVIFGGNVGNAITLTVPAATALVLAQVGRGAIHIQGVHTAVVARVRNGLLNVMDSSGEAYLETARGQLVVTNSGFNRVRARSALGNVMFANCNVRQIEVSSIRGHIAFDNGTFAPGLARFETQEGNIALGIASGGLQIGAHAGGRVVSAFDHGAGTISGTQNDAQARINGGGPVVTVNAAKGNVLLYSGSLKSKPHFRQWLPQARGTQTRIPPPARVRTCARPRCRV